MKKLLSIAILLFLVGQIGVSASTERVAIRGDHGMLAAELQLPPVMSKSCPIVILCHGFGGERNNFLMRSLADSLASHGIASIRFDFNGHGESEGSFEQMTVPNEIEDARCVYEWVRGDKRFTRIGIAGHSQGGVVTSMLAGQLGKRAFKGGVVLFAPAAVLRDDAIRGQIGGQAPFKGDPLDPPAYVEVWGRRLGRDYVTTAFRLPIYETAAGYKGKACIIHGTADRVVPYTYGLRYHQLWHGSEYHQLERFDHGLGPEPLVAVRLALSFFLRNN